MAEIALSEEQKGVVRRYVQTWRRWRPGIRAFAHLEDDLEKRYEVLVDGIAVDNRPDHPVVAAGNDGELAALVPRRLALCLRRLFVLAPEIERAGVEQAFEPAIADRRLE